MVKRVNKTAIVNGEGKNFLKKISIALVIFMMDILKLKYKEKLTIFSIFKDTIPADFRGLKIMNKKITTPIKTIIFMSWD